MSTRLSHRDAIHARPFRVEDFQGLLAPSEPPCISIYLPTHRGFPGWKQDPVRYRTLVGEAESLLSSGPLARQAAQLVEPLRALEQDLHWEHSLDGLAVFLSPHVGAAYRLPISVPELTVVADSFHVTPLIRFLHANRRYFALALSQNEATLYEGSPFGAEAVELRGLPEGLRGAIGVPDIERALSEHGAPPSGPIFHGRGPGKEETKEKLLHYFRVIDKGLHEFLREERAPLILASVKYYHPIYREANTYPHLLPEGLEGNFERANGAKIHAEAWPIVNRAFQKRVDEWIARYRELSTKGLAVDRLEEIGPAAIAGRVRCVLAAEGQTVWGRLDRATGAVSRHPKPEGPEDDLVDDMCEEALKRGAEVYVIARAAMPTESPIAAVFRF